MKIKIFNREICVCALLATNSFMSKKQRRNGEKMKKAIIIAVVLSLIALPACGNKDVNSTSQGDRNAVTTESTGAA